MISEYLIKINNCKQKIKEAIKNKTILINDSLPFKEYSNKINEIKMKEMNHDITKNLITRDVTSISIPNSVTFIGTSAFSYFNNLTSVTIPNSVTFIDNNAFGDCHKLDSVVIPNSVTSINGYAFSNCYFTSIIIPNSVTKIGNGVFSGCSRLASITIPSSVTEIGNYTFLYCFKLASITINKPKDSISGAPWKAPSTTQIIWTG